MDASEVQLELIDEMARLFDRAALRVAGYPEPQLVLEKRGQEASFLFIAHHEGRIVVPGYERWPFRLGGFPEARKTLRGVRARVVSLDQLLYEKLHHEQSAHRR